MTSVKVLVDSIGPIPCVNYLNGTPVIAERTGGSRIWSVGGRNRPRPPWPSVTPFMFATSEWNPSIIDKTYEVAGKKWGRKGTPAYVFPSTPVRTVIEADDGAVGLSRALAKNAGSRASLGETIAEAGQTLDLFTKRTKQIIRIAGFLKRGQMAEVVREFGWEQTGPVKKKLDKLRPSKRLSDGYLEIQFGIMPILQEIQNAAKIYSDGLTKRGAKVGKTSGVLPSPLDGKWSAEEGEDLPPLKSSGGYRGEVVNEVIRNANEIGILNAPSLLWDLTKLSFVFDWLIAVGKFLAALTGTAGLGNVLAWTNAQSRQASYTGPSVLSRNVLITSAYTGTRAPSAAVPSLKVLLAPSANGWGQAISLAAVARQQYR